MNLSFLSQLKIFSRPLRAFIILNMIAVTASAIADAAGGYFIKNITDALKDQSLDIILHYIPAIAGVIIMGILAKYAVKHTAGHYTFHIIRRIREKSVQSLLSSPLARLENQHSGDTISRLNNDLNALRTFLQDEFPNLLYFPFIFIMVASYLAILNPLLTLVAFAPLPLLLFLVHVLSRPMSVYAQAERSILGAMNSVAHDTINGISVVKTYHLEKVFFEKYASSAKIFLDNMLKRMSLQSRMALLNEFIRLFPFFVITGVGGYLTLLGQMSAGTLFAFIYLISFIVNPLNEFPSLLAEARVASSAMKRMSELLAQAEERKNGVSFPYNEGPVIEFRNIRFSYNEQTEVFHDVSFSVSRNKITALAGPSGSGKTLLFKLMCSFYEPDAGDMYLYGKRYSDWNPHAVRTQFGLVSQDTYLFPATVRENIAFGMPDAREEQILQAAKTANAHEFIMELPQSYDTFIGERGNRLSGGQRQRIEIARAVLKDAPILLLDEPTSALDTQSEMLVQEAIERVMADRTVIVIAHRLSTIQKADTILVIDSGRIKEEGTHYELLQKQGLYCRLYLKQFRLDEVRSVH